MHISPADIQAYLTIKSLKELRAMFELEASEVDPLQQCMVWLPCALDEENKIVTEESLIIQLQINSHSQKRLTAGLTALGIENEYESNSTNITRQQTYQIAKGYWKNTSASHTGRCFSFFSFALLGCRLTAC